MDKEQLIGKTEHIITEHEMEAWQKGKGDAAAGKILKVSEKLSVKQAIDLVRMYAALGDVHFLAQRFDTNVNEINKVLGAFGVSSIEDAKRLTTTGVIAELDAASTQQRDQDQLDQKAKEVETQAKVDAQVEAKVELTQEEKDLRLRERQDEAQTKNKRDQIRQLIAEGIDVEVEGMRIPVGLIGEFKSMIPHGVSALQRRFGGSGPEIKSEIRRLAPHIDLDMLRP